MRLRFVTTLALFAALAGAFAAQAGAATMAMGTAVSCLIRAGGTVACSGIAYNGAFGPDIKLPAGKDSSFVRRPLTIPGVTGAVDVSTADNHSCAAIADGTVHCWGSPVSAYGQPLTSKPEAALAGVTQVAVADDHACALIADRTVRCWGSAKTGRLGDGTKSPYEPDAPVQVSGLTDAVAITAAGDHTCALRADRTIVCWGAGQWGVLGNGSTKASAVPVPVDGISDAVSIEAGPFSNCAVHATGAVSCWGRGQQGRLGSGSLAEADRPVTVVGISDASSVSVGYAAACALRAGGRVSCWGFNGLAGLNGNRKPKRMSFSRTPVAVLGVKGASGVVAGSDVNCVVFGPGNARCWGAGFYGESGSGSKEVSLKPIAVKAPA